MWCLRPDKHLPRGAGVREDCERFREAAMMKSFMLARLTRQRDMLKIEEFFNTFREHVAVFYISPP